MRKLKHPITLFVVAVLVVIGVGVGVVAAVQTQTVYGPSWGRFTVAFPGRVYEERLPAAQAAMNVNYYSYGSYAGWTGHGVPISDAVSAHHIPKVYPSHYLRELVLELKGAFPVPPTESTEHINGFLLTRLGPLCESTFCEEALIALHNRTYWVVSATSSGRFGPVEAFLDSFQPIG
jgi:hypothetical protein